MIPPPTEGPGAGTCGPLLVGAADTMESDSDSETPAGAPERSRDEDDQSTPSVLDLVNES